MDTFQSIHPSPANLDSNATDSTCELLGIFIGIHLCLRDKSK